MSLALAVHPARRLGLAPLRFAHKYRVHIALIYTQAAAALLHFTRSGGSPREAALLLAAFFFWQWGVYLFNKTCDLVEDAISQPAEMLRPGEIATVRNVSLVMLAAPLLLALWLRRDPLPAILIFVGAILYSKPLPGLKLRVKNLFLVKELYSAIPGWAGSMAAMVCVYASRPVSLSTPGVEAFLLQLIVSTIAVEFVWDLRDVEGDRAAGVRSPAVVFGPAATRAIALALALVPAALSLANGRPSVQPWILPAGILLLPQKAPSLAYHLLIDVPFIACFWFSF